MVQLPPRQKKLIEGVEQLETKSRVTKLIPPKIPSRKNRLNGRFRGNIQHPNHFEAR